MLQPNASGERPRLFAGSSGPLQRQTGVACSAGRSANRLIVAAARHVTVPAKVRRAISGLAMEGDVWQLGGRRLVPTATSPVTGVATHVPEMVSNLVARLELLGVAPRRVRSPRRPLSPPRGLLRQRTGCARPY